MLTYGGQLHYESCELFGENATNVFLKKIECSPLKLKLFLLHSMYDWMADLSDHSFSTLEEFLVLYNFR